MLLSVVKMFASSVIDTEIAGQFWPQVEVSPSNNVSWYVVA